MERHFPNVNGNIAWKSSGVDPENGKLTIIEQIGNPISPCKQDLRGKKLHTRSGLHGEMLQA